MFSKRDFLRNDRKGLASQPQASHGHGTGILELMVRTPCIFAIFIVLFSQASVRAAQITGGKLIEDFSSLDDADFSASTGLWNVVDHVAEAAVISGGDASRPISFGDGSDGELNLSSGSYVFDTDLHPQGYNFTSVTIGSGVTLSVQGSRPLIIRSLSTVSIAPDLSADGEFGLSDPAADGQANNAAFPDGPQGGVGRACAGAGGSGGKNPSATTANDGTSGLMADGTPENNQGVTTTPLDGSPAVTGPGAPSSFDSNGFVCGTGGGGGAAHTDGVSKYATGAAGGAGGGAIRIVSVGDLSVGNVSANGGNGGSGANDTVACSGNGGGGSGGAVWLQTLKTLSASSLPSVAAGVGGSCGGPGASSISGSIRCDSAPGSRPACGGGDMDTDLAAPGQVSYVIQSRALDLGTYDATFSDPVVTSNPGSGSITIEYAGSADGIRFSSFTPNLQSLNDRQYRYIKFRITLTTATAAAASPTVSRIEIPFQDLGPANVDLALGCATLGPPGKGPRNGSREMLFWAMFLMGVYSMTRLRFRF